MKFKIFLLQLIGICFVGLTSVIAASPFDTIPPPITDAFIPANQRSVKPTRNPSDFIGRVFAPKPGDRQPPRSEAQPITGVTVTIASGPRAGESVATNPSGYYRFPNVKVDELHLRLEKDHFEPKEVRVHRSRPTVLANGDVPNYTRDPQQHPGNILIGHRWPDEVRFILEEILVVHDLLYVEGGRLPEGTDLGGFYSLGVVVLYSYQYADRNDIVGLLGTFAHEIAHAHQHATVSVDGSAWAVHGWQDTPEGRAYEEARRKDWEQVGKSPLDNAYGRGHGGGDPLGETAAETCAHYWSVDRWGGRTAYGLLEIEAPNRYKWAEKWVPVSIPVRPPPKVVSISDPNLEAIIRKALGLEANAPITQQAMQRLTQLEARNSQIKNLTGLEHAKQLRFLELRENQIRDIHPLTHLKGLRGLILDDNRVRDISPLTNITQLTELYIGNNPISDFTPLVNLNQLEHLALWGVNIGDATVLAKKIKLTHLWLGRSNVRDITPLANLVNLKVLDLRDNSIRDIRPLAELTKLEDLKLDGNPITDTSTLRILKTQNPNLKVDIEIPPPSPVAQTEPPKLKTDVTGDGVVNILDLILIAQYLGETAPANSGVDVNDDGTVSILDLILVAQQMGKSAAAAPSAIIAAMNNGQLNPAMIQAWIEQVEIEDDGSVAFQEGIAFLQSFLAVLMPEETALLPNYPNPFNPETWIPYQLAKDADVTLTIYAVNGHVVRMLPLGHQRAGMYQNRSRAAYWDGKNEVGEPVASGIYVYHIQAGAFSATRRMLILK